MAVKKRKVRESRKKRKNGFGFYKKSALWIAIILVIVTGCIGISAVSLQKKNEAYKQQEQELEKQIEAEQKKADEVEDFKEYVNTEEYEKELAEDKLGLVDPNEILFKAVD